MESLAYLYQALAYETPPAVSPVLSNRWQSLLAKLRERKLLTQAPTYLISLVIILSICSLTGSALARNLLRKGSSGEDVTFLQQQLAHAGLYSGPINGKFGELTESAVKKFQSNLSLKVDGIVGSQTWAKLESNNTPQNPHHGGNLPYTPYPHQAPIVPDNFPKAIPQYKIYAKKGDRGSKVSYLQEELLFRGFYQGKIDGVYGSQTENAVKRFQSAHNLAITGFVDEFTLKELQKPVIDFELTQPAKPKTKFASVVVPISHTEKVQYLSKDSCAFPDAFDCSQDSSEDKVVAGGSKQYYYNNRFYGVNRGSLSLTLPTLRSGRANDRELVRGLQEILRRLGYNPGGVDGRFGSSTRSAVSAFQSSRSLRADGIVGSQTWRALADDLRRSGDDICRFLPSNYCNGIYPRNSGIIDSPPLPTYVVAIPDENGRIWRDRGDFARRSTIEILENLSKDNNSCPGTNRFYGYQPSSKLGAFINMGYYYDQGLAQNCSNALREAGFDARVIHRDRIE